MTDRVAQLEAALRGENALIVEAQRLLTAYIQGSQRAPPSTACSRGAAIGRRCPRAARDACCAIVCASAQNAARAGVRGGRPAIKAGSVSPFSPQEEAALPNLRPDGEPTRAEFQWNCRESRRQISAESPPRFCSLRWPTGVAERSGRTVHVLEIRYRPCLRPEHP
jgi:hypothetical protein